MASDANPPHRSPAEAAADERRLGELATELADVVEAVVPGWIESLIVERVRDWSGHVSAEIAAEAVTAGEAARDDLMPPLRELLAADVDEQAANPLELLRIVTQHAGVVLDRHGVPASPRDRFAARSFPADVHGLMPATWADVDERLHEPGIAWGAAKAFVHRARRRDQGMA